MTVNATYSLSVNFGSSVVSLTNQQLASNGQGVFKFNIPARPSVGATFVLFTIFATNYTQ